MNVLIIGAGRVGSSFGYLLNKHKYNIKGIYNKHYCSSQKAVDKIGDGCPLEKSEISEVLSEVDLIIITTPDDYIKEMANYIINIDFKKPVYIMHMSGLYTSEILNVKNLPHIHTFSLHPLQAIPSFEKGINLLPESFFTLEGDDEGLEYGQNLAESLNLNYDIIEKQYKALYHTAAVIASNYLVTLLAVSYDLLDEVDLLKPAVKQGMMNLVQGTLSNITQNDPQAVLTGPIARGDFETIRLHLQALGEFKPEYLELYQLLGKYTAEIKDDENLKQFFVDRLTGFDKKTE